MVIVFSYSCGFREDILQALGGQETKIIILLTI